MYFIDYWIEKLINEIPLLRRFTKAFNLEGLSGILEFNYFYHQIKGTAIGTLFVVVGSNLMVAYFEEKCLLFYHRFIQKTFSFATIFDF